MFREYPNAAVIIGGETQSTFSKLSHRFSGVGIKRAFGDCNDDQCAEEPESISQDRPLSDSGYGSNTGNGSSGRSLTSSMVGSSPSDEEAGIAGAASGPGSGRKAKRRKIDSLEGGTAGSDHDNM